MGKNRFYRIICRMDAATLRSILKPLPLGGLRFFDQLGSSNDAAMAWAKEGAPDLSLVVADEQTAGRGRAGRTWFTPAGTALAFSLVLRPDTLPRQHLPRLTALGALAVADALRELWGLESRIKWPNDLLLNGRKCAGMLVESDWAGERLRALVLGIGVNVEPGSIPPADALSFPATCVEAETGQQVDRWSLLREVLRVLIERRKGLSSPTFIQDWEARLAFRGEAVQISGSEAPVRGVVVGLQTASGEERTLPDGEVRLRRVDSRLK